MRVRETRGGPDGSMITSVSEDALSDVSRDRIGGVIVVTDGQAADPPPDPARLRDLGPAHILIVGDPERRDRRLELISAPTFGIVGEPMRITGRVIDNGGSAPVRVTVSIDGVQTAAVNARANQQFAVDVRLPHRGRNMVVVEAAAGAEEITLANNRQAFAANGVRDRLRVLLITGEPHQGARVWRNLLKSDPAVDLVHDELVSRYGVRRVGRCEGVEERFFAVGTEKRVSHPLVARLLPQRQGVLVLGAEGQVSYRQELPAPPQGQISTPGLTKWAFRSCQKDR